MTKRFYTVAKEFGLSSNFLMDFLEEKGIKVADTEYSYVTDSEYAIIKKSFGEAVEHQKQLFEEAAVGYQIKENNQNIELINITEDGVEKEDNSQVTIEIPFNPNDIRVRTEPHTIGQLVDRLEYNEINLNTEFQRLANLWSNTKKSRFIESLILKLPIPMFYFAESEKRGVWDVVDGLQRISTIKHFILEKENKALRLENLEFLKEYNGKTFKDLPRELTRRIKTFPVTIYIIEKGTPDIVKFNIFSRINQGGLILTPQEIRHAIHQGSAADTIADMVRQKDIKDDNGKIIKESTSSGLAFAKATQYKIRADRMQDRDFANRFVSFYLIPYQEYQPDLDSFMNKGLMAIKKLSKSQINLMMEDFEEAMHLSTAIFGNDAFRKRFNLNDRRKPINKALFEVLSVSFAKLPPFEKNLLKKKKNIFKKLLRDLHNEPKQKFLKSISSGTALKENVNYRFKSLETIIHKTLNDDSEFKN